MGEMWTQEKNTEARTKSEDTRSDLSATWQTKLTRKTLPLQNRNAG